MHLREVGVAGRSAWPDHADCGVEAGALAAELGQLLVAALRGARFAQDLCRRAAAQAGDLVAADNDGIREFVRNGLRLGLGQSQGPRCREFARQGRFIDARGAALEGHAEPLQQFPAIGGGGGKDEQGGWDHGFAASSTPNKHLE